MESKKLQFTSKPGTFIDSIRAYREYQKEWRARMDIKLTEIEEQIKRAKSDSFFKMETVWRSFKTEMVIDEGMENFIAIIVPRSHPYLDDIIERFDAEIAMFKSNKP